MVTGRLVLALDDEVSSGERRVGVASLKRYRSCDVPFSRETRSHVVGLPVRMNHAGIRCQSIVHRADHFEWLELQLDRFHGGSRLVPALGCDRNDRLALIADDTVS